MEPNNRNNRNRGDKNRRRGGGMWSIVLWALLLTIGVNYLSVMLDQARTAESSCEIAYSELVELVEEGKVKSIEFGDSVFTITPVDGFTYTDDDGKRYDQNYTLFTTIIPDATEKLITLCDEHGVTYTKPYQPPVSPILTFMVSYILPTVLMVGAFMLLMNFITKKSGGMGGIGDIVGEELCPDLPALRDIPVALIATSPKDVVDIPATLRWLREAGVRLIGADQDRCTGYLFNCVDIPLDHILADEPQPLGGRTLILNGIPGEKRIADNSLLAQGIAAGHRAVCGVRELAHPGIVPLLLAELCCALLDSCKLRLIRLYTGNDTIGLRPPLLSETAEACLLRPLRPGIILRAFRRLHLLRKLLQ